MGNLLVGKSNAWLSVFKKWDGNESLEKVTDELINEGCYSAATIMNEWIYRLLKQLEEKRIMTTFFTSDLHIGHVRCAVDFRPHSSLDDMHDFIITAWNGTITNNDDVYVLGDVFMGEWKTLEKANDFLNHLNFKSFSVIPGNHDKPSFLREISIHREKNDLREFNILSYLVEKRFPVESKNTKMYPLVCSHYPLASWSTVAKGIGHVHGHCHMAYKGKGRILDVGWDGFYTERKKGIWSVDEIKEYMNKQEIFSVDYH